MISGYGSVNGNFTVGSGARLAPGGSVGTLTFSNSLTLAAGSTNFFEISKSPLTNDVARIFGALTNGGTLVVTNIGAVPLTAGDSFKLFSAGSYGGGFASSMLPALTPGLAWNTNLLNSAGQLSVISIVPTITTVSLFGTNFVLRGSGGLPNGKYYVLASTNVALPLAGWPRIATNSYDASGNFNFTNVMASGAVARFYRLQLP